MNNHNKFLELRKEYKFLSFEKYEILEDFDSIKVVYLFNLSDKIFFKPYFKILKKEFSFLINVNDIKFHNLVFNIGMIELISYWKAACPKVIRIFKYNLYEKQILWWKKLYFNGLGEFFYTNKIQTNQKDFVEIIAKGKEKNLSSSYKTFSKFNLIAVSGGKDSSLSLELLQKNFKNNISFVLNPSKTTLKTLKKGNSKIIFEIHRKISPELLELNKKGFLNGHTPFSALLAFYSLLASAFLGVRNIIFSNESSANESTVPDTKINHQYSKSFEFEKDFRNYVKKYISSDFNYFSFLRPLNEFQISYLFSKHNRKYFEIFKSCNLGSKLDIWCCDCPKCLFTYIILSPFNENKILEKVFGENLLDKKKLLKTFKQLIGVEKDKPFECVGTVDEINYSLHIVLKKYENLEMPFLLDFYKKNFYEKNIKNNISNFYDGNNFLEEKFEKIIKKEINFL